MDRTPTPDLGKQDGGATFHLVCGLPGSGKSTLAARLVEETGAIGFSPDTWLTVLGADGYDQAARDRVETLQWQLARQLLARGVSVVLENGFWIRAERDRYRAEAKELGAGSIWHFLDVPLDELSRRIVARNRDPRCLFRVDPADLDGWSAQFELPEPDELTAIRPYR